MATLRCNPSPGVPVLRGCRLFAKFAAFGFLCSALVPTCLEAQELPRAREFSRTKQFVVYCDDETARRQVVVACEEIKDRFLKMLGRPDEWKLPIVVVLRVPPSTEVGTIPWSFNVSKSTEGVKLQIDFAITRGIERIRLTDRVVEALITEMLYRDGRNLVVGGTFQRPYPWLVEGFGESLIRQENPFPPEFISAILQASQSISIRDMLKRDPGHLDSVSHEIYRVYAMSLLEMLLAQPGGQSSMVRYLRGIPTRSPEEMFDFGEEFRSLGNTPEAVDKWWALTLAKMATSEKFRPLTPAVTEERLLEILRVNVPESFFKKPKQKPEEKEKGKDTEAGSTGEATDGLIAVESAEVALNPAEPSKSFAIEEFHEFAKLSKPRRKAVLSPVLLGLYGLGTTAHPMFYAIVGEYQRLVGLVAEGKTVGLEAEFQRLAETRKRVLEMYAEVDDYMNWFEATQIETLSGSFENYFKAAEELERMERPPRKDVITRYLEVVEAELQ